MAAAEAKQLEDDHQPRNVTRKRIAEPGAVRQDQVGLELGEAVIGDPGVGEDAETGVDAVHDAAAGNDPVDRSGGFVDALESGVVKFRARSAPEVAQGAERDLRGVELDHEPIIGRSSPCSRAQSIAISYPASA